MKAILQDQLAWNQVTHKNLSFYKSISIDSIVVTAPDSVGDDPKAFTDGLPRFKDLIESHGMTFYVVQMAENCWDEIIFNGHGKEKKIEKYCSILRAMGEVGIPVMGYVFIASKNVRTTSAIGRAGSRYSTFDFREYEQTHPGYADELSISEEKLWKNFECFLKAVIPVAEQAGVRMGLHPNDPPRSEPLGGAPRLFTSVESFDRALSIIESDSNALEFCQGCFAEMGINVYKAIEHFGSLGKILYVHFRNIKGNPPRYFEECFIDEGIVDMVRAMQIYKEVGFSGPFMMDHSPSIPDDTNGRIGHAYAAGHIRGIMQSVYGWDSNRSVSQCKKS